MRIISLIFVAVFSILATFPCSDGSTCADEKKIGSEFTSSVGNHDHSASEIDICSPLCVCNCCSTQVNQPVAFHFEAQHIQFSDYNPVQQSDSFPTVYYGIWQPPKLA